MFGTVEFKGSLGALPNWTEVVRKAPDQMAVLGQCRSVSSGCPSAAGQWQDLLKEAEPLPAMEKLKRVNVFFNRWPYRLDQDAYGRSDYWAAPLEFFKTSGDCEDFSIVKYFALKQLGFSSEGMRVVILKDDIRSLGHAVLVVLVEGQYWVLDNLSDPIFPDSLYTHYQPQYSVNESSRWIHIRPMSGALPAATPRQLK